MKYRVVDNSSNEFLFFDTPEQAIQKHKELAQKYLSQQAYRFAISSMKTVGNHTVWRNVTAEDPEGGAYQVFNHATGQHELVHGKQAAYDRMHELQREFVDNLPPIMRFEDNHPAILHPL